MQLLHIEKLEVVGPVTVIFGTVQNETISVGQTVHLVAADGTRETAELVGIIPNHSSAKRMNQGAPGESVKLLLKRRNPTLELAPAMTIQKLPS